MKIAFIEPASAGTAGLYVDEYYKVLNDKDVLYFTNYYHQSSYAYKVFFKYSELGKTNVLFRYKYLRQVLRVLEYFIACVLITYNLFRFRVDTIFYAISGDNSLTYYFLFFLKWFLRKRLILIVHDVLPFGISSSYYNSKVSKQVRLFRLADKLLVHNNYSIETLVKLKFNREIIFKINFPVFDVNDFECFGVNELSFAKSYYLFAGHIREEKGVELLFQVWNEGFSHKNLVIAGLFPEYLFRKIRNTFKENPNVIIINKYLTDCELLYLIKLSDAVLLPYIFGTNSGILSLCLGLKKGMVLSDIEMFVDYKKINGLNFFEANNADDLRNLLFKIQQADGDLLDVSEYQLQEYKNEFRMQLLQVFKNLECNRISVK